MEAQRRLPNTAFLSAFHAETQNLLSADNPQDWMHGSIFLPSFLFFNIYPLHTVSLLENRGSHVAQAILKFTMQPRMALNS